MRLRSVRRQRGITLIEIILWAAIVAVAVVAAFMFSQRASVNAAVESEQRHIEDIVKTVDGLFATRSDFTSLGTNGAAFLQTNAGRAGLRLGTNASGEPALLTGLGNGTGTLTLSVQSVSLGGGPATPNNGYRLAYNRVTSDECVKMVGATYPIAHRVSVSSDLNDASGTTLSERGQMVVTPDRIAQSCSASARPSVFLYFVPARAIAATAGATPPPLARCNPVHEVQQTACPAGQLGSITQERDGTCTGPGNSLVYTAWTTTDNTCQAPPVAPPTITPPTNPDNCTTITVTRAAACPAGQIGLVTQQSTQNTCSGTTTPWTTISSSCQAPPTTGTCKPSTENRTQPCPAGQGGQITQSRSSTCASPTSAPVWGGWNTISNTCTTSCSQGGNSCCTVRRETQPGPECPAGTWGAAGQQERFLGCVNAQTQASSWTPWQDMTSGTCNTCPATTSETQTQWVDRVDPCPTGMTGDIKYQAEQVRTRDVSYNCPAGTTALPAPTYTGWGTWADTGARRNIVNSCTVSGSCYELTDYYGGTLDTHDAYFGVNYTANGVAGGCIATMRDDGPTGAMNCNPGSNGVLDLDQWSRVANVGETYVTSGSQSGWGGSRHEFWGWDYNEFTLVNTSCRTSTGCGWNVNGNYSPLGTGYATFWRYEYTESSGANNAQISCTGSGGSTYPASCSGSGPGFAVGGTYTNASALTAILPAAFDWMAYPDNEGAADHSLAQAMGARIDFNWQVNGTGIGSGTLERNSSCPNNVSCTIPAGTVFNWTVGGNACTFTQPSATSVATGAAFTANDTTGPATGTANFSCLASGMSTTPLAGATCNVPAACTAGSGPTVIHNTSEVTNGSDQAADTFVGSTSDFNEIAAGGITCNASTQGRLMAVLQGGPVDIIKGTVFICRPGGFDELWSQDYLGGWNNVSVTSLGSATMGIPAGYHANAGVIPSQFRPASPISNVAGLTDWDDQPGTNKGADYFWFATWVCGGGTYTSTGCTAGQVDTEIWNLPQPATILRSCVWGTPPAATGSSLVGNTILALRRTRSCASNGSWGAWDVTGPPIDNGYWHWSVHSSTGADMINGCATGVGCTGSPGVSTRWVARSKACPNGTTHTWEQMQIRTNASCSNGSWTGPGSNWVDVAPVYGAANGSVPVRNINNPC